MSTCCLLLLAGTQAASSRLNKDIALAAALADQGLPSFVQSWYLQPMWSSLNAHPRSAASVICMATPHYITEHACFCVRPLLGPSCARGSSWCALALFDFNVHAMAHTKTHTMQPSCLHTACVKLQQNTLQDALTLKPLQN